MQLDGFATLYLDKLRALPPRRGVDIEGEPRNVFEKLEDCAVVHRLTGATPAVSLHLPWDACDDYAALKARTPSSAMSIRRSGSTPRCPPTGGC